MIPILLKAAWYASALGAVSAALSLLVTFSGVGSVGASSHSITPTPAPTVMLSANPTTVASGDASTLTWSSSNARQILRVAVVRLVLKPIAFAAPCAIPGWPGIRSLSAARRKEEQRAGRLFHWRPRGCAGLPPTDARCSALSDLFSQRGVDYTMIVVERG